MIILNELINIYNNNNNKKYKLWLKNLINIITNKYFLSLNKWNFHQKWLAKKYFTIWKINTIFKLKKFKLFNLINYQTWAKVIDVYDGDTIKIIMNFRNHIDMWNVRMNGYDSPELKPNKKNVNRNNEIIEANKAKEALKIKTNDIIFIKIVGFDKYGRILADIFDKNNLHINNWMIQNGFGYPYNGGKKQIFNH